MQKRKPGRDRQRGEESKDLESVLRIAQNDAKGLVIAAHPDRDKGLPASETVAHWWRQEESCRPELHAVALPQPPHEFNPDGFLYRGLANKEPGWWNTTTKGWLFSQRAGYPI